MADESTYLIRLAAWLGHSLGQTAPLFTEFSTETLGVELPDAVVHAPLVAAALGQAEIKANQLNDVATELETVAASGDEIEILARFVQLGLSLGEFYTVLDDLADTVRGSITVATIPDATARAAASAFAEVLAKRLSDYAIASTITERIPELAFVLKLLGLLDWQYQDPDSSQLLSRAHVRKGLQLHRVKGLISDPGAHFRETIGWGDASFDPTDFFDLVGDFFDEEDDIEIGEQSGEPFLRGCLLIRRDSTLSPPGLSLTLIGESDADQDVRTEINESWGLSIASNFRMVGGISGQVAPPLTFKLQPQSGEITGEIREIVLGL